MSDNPGFTKEEAIKGAEISESDFGYLDGRVCEGVGGGKFAVSYAPFREYVEYEQMAESGKIARWGMVLAIVAIVLTITQLIIGMGTPQAALSSAQMTQLLSAVREPVALRDSVIVVRVQGSKTPFGLPKKP
jgi:hypothetical protein